MYSFSYLFIPILGFGESYDKNPMEFVFAIPISFHYGQPFVTIKTSSEAPVFTTLYIPGTDFEVQSNVTKHQSADIILSQEIVGKGAHKYRDGLKASTTIVVSSSDAVSVYFITDDYCCNDGTVVIPSTQLGTRYVIATYRPYSSSFPSFFCVSSLYEHTSVNITRPDGRVEHLALSQYTSYQLDGADYEDLSGTQLESNRPIAVISGSRPSIFYGVGGINDFLPPVESWSRQYIMTPMQSLSKGYLYRVFAIRMNTTINMSNSNMTTLQPGEYYEGNAIGDTLVEVVSNKPVMVVQYIKESPSMLIVPPITSYTNNSVTFPVMMYNWTGHTHHINIISECRYIGEFLFDDNIEIDDWEQLTLADMCCIRGRVTTGTHTVSHANPLVTFFVFVYALRYSSSYAYSAQSYFSKGMYISAKI